MKNILRISLLGFLTILSVITIAQGFKALPDENINKPKMQSWPVSGAQWTYCITGWNGQPAGEETMQMTGDTLIEGKTYKVMIFVNSGESSHEYKVENNNDINERMLFTRFENDTVYRFVNNQEYLFFTFNLNLGDVFTTFRTAGWNNHWQDSACTSILPLKVIEKDEINLNGQIFSRIVLQDTLISYLYDIQLDEPVTYTLIERIGVINAYPFINTIEHPNSCNLPTDFVLGSIGRYSDFEFEYEFKECQSVGIEQPVQMENSIKIYPNPSSGLVYVQNLESVSGQFYYQLYNNLGIQEKSGKLKTQDMKIDFSALADGQYHLVLIAEDKSQSVFRFKI
jgi:hypothetical protein